MGLMDILKGVAGVASLVVPGVAPVIAGINAFLPDDEKLPGDATGEQINAAYDKLPPDAQVRVKEIAASVEIATVKSQADVYKSLAAADGQSTRPRIALMMAQMLCIPYCLIGVAMAWVIGQDPAAIGDMWPTLLAYLGVPMSVLKLYFGELRKEQANRLHAPQPPSLLETVAGVFTGGAAKTTTKLDDYSGPEYR